MVTTGQTAVFEFTNTPILGAIKILKLDDLGGYLGGATFTISPDPYGGTDPLTVVDNDGNDADATDGIILLQNVPLGSYTITETVAPPGYQLDPIPQTKVVTTGQTAVFEFTNTELHSLQIEKHDKDSGEIIDLPGITFTISPDPYGGAGPLEVEDNVSAYDMHTTGYGIILLENIPSGWYTITETAAPLGYQLDSTPQTVYVGSIVTVTFFDSPLGECDGLTPGYWKNWSNHYTPEQFAALLAGTYAPTIAAANVIFASYNFSPGEELSMLGAFLLATQLTLNLTNMTEMPNPDGAFLTEFCEVEWDGETWNVGDAITAALAILSDPDPYNTYTHDYIEKVKNILDMICNLPVTP